MDALQELIERVWKGAVMLAIVLIIGTLGLYTLGGGEWRLLDCLYMVVITIATVGYDETVPVSESPAAEVFVILLIVFGMGVILYFASSVVAIVVEGDLRKLWRRRKMFKMIERMSDHIVICGAGIAGGHVMREMIATRRPFVTIEQDEKKIETFKEKNKITELSHIIGDATEIKTLVDAGIERARGIIVALPDDKDCLIVTVTARQLRKDLRIVSKAAEPDYIRRIKEAGADAVVSPNALGGIRLVSQMVRPTVVQFLDLMLRDKDKNLRIEQVDICDSSDIVGKKLSETDIRRTTNLLVIAAQNSFTGEYHYNPGPDFVVDKGTVLIVLGSTADVIKVREEYGID